MSQLKSSVSNPLDFEARKQMILAEFPNVIVSYVKDTKCDKIWSKNLDGLITDLITPNQKVTLYGSRDSFIPYYSGRFKTVELHSDKQISATEVREKAAANCINSPEFRAGVVWSTFNQYPAVISTVDIAIFNEDYSQVLLGRKPNESNFRFIGGFSDTNSISFEADAKREAMEETSLEVSTPEYIGSFNIDDWRYRKDKNKIRTLFFFAKKVYGKEKASDDIQEVKWFKLKDLSINDLEKEHHVLLESLKLRIG